MRSHVWQKKGLPTPETSLAKRETEQSIEYANGKCWIGRRRGRDWQMPMATLGFPYENIIFTFIKLGKKDMKILTKLGWNSANWMVERDSRGDDSHILVWGLEGGMENLPAVSDVYKYNGRENAGPHFRL